MKLQTKTNEIGRLGFPTDNFEKIHEKMKMGDFPVVLINNLKYYYNQLINGTTGEIPESEIEPLNLVLGSPWNAYNANTTNSP